MTGAVPGRYLGAVVVEGEAEGKIQVSPPRIIILVNTSPSDSHHTELSDPTTRDFVSGAGAAC